MTTNGPTRPDKPELQIFYSEDGQTFLEEMFEVTRKVTNDRLRQMERNWMLVSYRSKQNLLKAVFDEVRSIMRVGEPGGPSPSTFNSYRTKIMRCMVFHVSLSDARYNNRGLSMAMDKALKMKGGSLRDRMKKALDECKQDPNWPGHPPRISEQRR